MSINWIIVILFIVLYVCLQYVFFELMSHIPVMKEYIVEVMDHENERTVHATFVGKLFFTTLFVIGYDLLLLGHFTHKE